MPFDATPESPKLQCLRQMRTLLEDSNCWGQKGLGGCLLTTMQRVAGTQKVPYAMLWKATLAFQMLSELPPGYNRWWPESLVRFNDNPETTHADVMAFLDRVIRKFGG